MLHSSHQGPERGWTPRQGTRFHTCCERPHTRPRGYRIAGDSSHLERWRPLIELGEYVTLWRAKNGRKDISPWAKKLAQKAQRLEMHRVSMGRYTCRGSAERTWNDAVDQPGPVFKVTRASGLSRVPCLLACFSSSIGIRAVLYENDIPGHVENGGRGEAGEKRRRERRHCKSGTRDGQRDPGWSVCLWGLRKWVTVRPSIPGPSGTWHKENTSARPNFAWSTHSVLSKYWWLWPDVAIWQEPNWCFHFPKVERLDT